MVAHLLAYFYCIYRKQKGGPIRESVVNTLMIAGIVQNILIAVRLGVWNLFQLAFALPIVLLVFALIRNYRGRKKTLKG
jgi:hypothetical protein